MKNDTIRFTDGCQFSDLFGKWELTDSMEEILRGMAYFESEILGYYPACHLRTCLVGIGGKIPFLNLQVAPSFNLYGCSRMGV